MATKNSTSDKSAQVSAEIFEEIAQIVGNLDRECYWLLGDPMQKRDAEDIDLHYEKRSAASGGWLTTV